MRTTRREALKGLSATAAALAAPAARAQQAWPATTIRIVVPFAAGALTDLAARAIAAELSTQLGQQVIVENKGGAFYPNAPVRIERDFVPVAQVASLPFLLVANPSVPAGTVAELIAYAKTKPGQLSYSSSGNGSTLHLAGGPFNEMAGIKATHIGYKGSAPSIADLVGGHVQWAFDAPSLTMPHVRAGRLRAIGHTAATRLPSLPDIAPIAETLPGYEVLNWYGIAAPAGTPADPVKRLGEAIRTAMSDAEVRGRISGLGIDPVATRPEAFRRFADGETAKWTQVIRRGNISAN